MFSFLELFMVETQNLNSISAVGLPARSEAVQGRIMIDGKKMPMPGDGGGA